MGITHANRKGVTYYLCRRRAASGAERYVFAREPAGELVDDLPPGFAIRESINGIVSLVRDRPSRLLSEEVAAVERAVARHPQASRYRVDAPRNRIDVHERAGVDVTEVVKGFGLDPAAFPRQMEDLQAAMERDARYAAVLRFTLVDATQRTFQTERMCYLGSVDGFIPIGSPEPIWALAERMIPVLGTEQFFELW